MEQPTKMNIQHQNLFDQCLNFYNQVRSSNLKFSQQQLYEKFEINQERIMQITSFRKDMEKQLEIQLLKETHRQTIHFFLTRTKQLERLVNQISQKSNQLQNQLLLQVSRNLEKDLGQSRSTKQDSPGKSKRDPTFDILLQEIESLRSSVQLMEPVIIMKNHHDEGQNISQQRQCLKVLQNIQRNRIAQYNLKAQIQDSILRNSEICLKSSQNLNTQVLKDVRFVNQNVITIDGMQNAQISPKAQIYEKQIIRLNQLITSLQNANESFQKQNKRLNQQQEQIIVKKELMARSNKQLSSKINLLEKQNQKSKLADLENLKKIQQRNRQLQRDIKRYSEQLQNYRAKAQKLSKDNKELQNSNLLLKKNNEQQIKKSTQSHKGQAQQLWQKIIKLESIVESKEELQVLLDDLRKTNLVKDSKISNLEEKVKTMEKKVVQTDKKIQKVEKKLQETQRILNQKQREVEYLTTQMSKVNRLNENLQSAEQSLIKQNNQLQINLKIAFQMKNQYQIKIDGLKQTIQMLDKNISQKDSIIQDLLIQNQSLKQAHQCFEQQLNDAAQKISMGLSQKFHHRIKQLDFSITAISQMI